MPHHEHTHYQDEHKKKFHLEIEWQRKNKWLQRTKNWLLFSISLAFSRLPIVCLAYFSIFVYLHFSQEKVYTVAIKRGETTNGV